MADQPHMPAPALEDRFRDGAPTKRELAWELLKQTRNAAYVAMRYGYDVETMEKALAKIPVEEPLFRRLNPDWGTPPQGSRSGEPTSAGELLPDFEASREPGEDDELGE